MLHVITRMIVGGAQENTLLSVLGTDSRPGWRSVLVTGPSPGPEGELLAHAGRSADSVRMITVPSLCRELDPLSDARAFFRLLWLFWRLRPTVVHTHSSKAGILGRVAARLAGVPVVVHTIHGLPFHEFQGRWAYRFYVLCERIAAVFADRIYGVADAMCDQALAAGVGRRGQFLRVWSGMRTASFLAAGEDPAVGARVRARLSLPADAPVLVMVARLFELKGHDDLFAVAPEVVRAVPELRILLVGDGNRREELAAIASDMGLADRVVFTGLVAPGEIPELLAASDLLVHTSVREGLARVLPQAMLVGLPVVSYDVDGAREVVTTGETGALVDVGDRASLCAWIVSLLSDPAGARAMAARGRELCRRRFDADTMVDTLLTDYLQQLHGRRVD